MGQNNRRHPRSSFESEVNVGVSGPPVDHRIVDVSTGGIAILAGTEFKPGTKLLIRYAMNNSVEVTVIGSEMVEDDQDFMDYAYRVRTKFVNESLGKIAYDIFISSRGDAG